MHINKIRRNPDALVRVVESNLRSEAFAKQNQTLISSLRAAERAEERRLGTNLSLPRFLSLKLSNFKSRIYDYDIDSPLHLPKAASRCIDDPANSSTPSLMHGDRHDTAHRHNHASRLRFAASSSLAFNEQLILIDTLFVPFSRCS